MYFNKLALNIVLQSELNDININSKTNVIFNFLNAFYFCSVYHHKTSLVNFVSDAAIFAKNLMNC